MGTNYYHRKNICPTCERYDEEHLGKNSAGWTFTFHGTQQIRSYQHWLTELEKGGEIYNEYGEKISLDEFKQMVKSKKNSANNHAAQYGSDRDWADPEGHSFSGHEFS